VGYICQFHAVMLCYEWTLLVTRDSVYDCSDGAGWTQWALCDDDRQGISAAAGEGEGVEVRVAYFLKYHR
jgi:hypothetical protein